MFFQTVLDKSTPLKVFRAAVNANTGTLTLTAASIAIGSPVVLATASDSANGQYITRPATNTSVVNNLFVGNLSDAPGSKVYLGAEEVGVVQIYGIDDDAIVQTLTTTSLAGQVLAPESLQFLIPTGGPVTLAGTGSNIELPGIGGLAILMQSIASSAATSTGTAKVFLRCM